MAILLMIAVFPISLAMSRWGAPILATIPLAIGSAITSMIMVLSMTYVIVPILTKIFGRWLNSNSQR